MKALIVLVLVLVQNFALSVQSFSLNVLDQSFALVLVLVLVQSFALVLVQSFALNVLNVLYEISYLPTSCAGRVMNKPSSGPVLVWAMDGKNKAVTFIMKV